LIAAPLFLGKRSVPSSRHSRFQRKRQVRASSAIVSLPVVT